MSVVTDTKLIAPHGGTLVDRTGEPPGDVDTLEVVTLTSRRAHSSTEVATCTSMNVPHSSTSSRAFCLVSS